MTPTWDGWPAVIVAQNADVESHSECLYAGIWNQDHRDWVPEVYDTGITWDICHPFVYDSVEMTMYQSISASQSDMWSPVRPVVSTTWLPVQYPN